MIWKELLTEKIQDQNMVQKNQKKKKKNLTNFAFSKNITKKKNKKKLTKSKVFRPRLLSKRGIKNQKKLIKPAFTKILTKKGKKNISEKNFKQILLFLRKKKRKKSLFILYLSLKRLFPGSKLIRVQVHKNYTINTILPLKDEKRFKESFYLIFKVLELPFKNSSDKNFKTCNEIIKISKKKSPSKTLKRDNDKLIKKLKRTVRF